MAFGDPLAQGIRQIKRWILAARQDQDPAVKWLHASYAVGNIDLVRQMYSDEDMKLKTGEDIQYLMLQATSLQDQAQLALVARCGYVW